MRFKFLPWLVLVLSVAWSGCVSITKPADHRPAGSLEHVFQQIGRQVPELGSVGMISGIPASGQVWQGDEYVGGAFYLPNNVKHHPAGELPGEPAADFFVTITRYASAEDAQNNLSLGLLRNQGPQPREDYQGAALYRWRYASGGTANVVCHSGLYIVEINSYDEAASPWIMKVLDIVLTELPSSQP